MSGTRAREWEERGRSRVTPRLRDWVAGNWQFHWGREGSAGPWDQGVGRSPVWVPLGSGCHETTPEVQIRASSCAGILKPRDGGGNPGEGHPGGKACIGCGCWHLEPVARGSMEELAERGACRGVSGRARVPPQGEGCWQVRRYEGGPRVPVWV